MSRVGKNPVEIPKGVKAEVKGQVVKVEGPKGKLERSILPNVAVKLVDNQIVLSRAEETNAARAQHGTERALVHNMVTGVSEGFVKELDLIGVGYRAEMSGTTLNLALGYSHTIDFPIPAGVKGSVVKEGRDITVRLEGADRALVGQVAAKIRSLREPEPYKGKGVRYKGEVVKLKAGKAGKK